MNSTLKNFIPQKEVYRIRVSKIVDRLMRDSEVFQEELDQGDLVELLTNEMRKFSLKEFLLIDDDDLSRRIGRIIALNMLSKLSEDFTHEQKRIFDEAVGG